MTSIWCEINGEELSLEIEGHATGSPEACAGISALVEALGTYIMDAGAGHVNRLYERWIEDGSCGFRLRGDKTMAEVWRLVCIGLMQISMACPDQVSMLWNGAV